MSRTPVEKIGEFGLIKRIRALLEGSQRLPPGFLGIGDDSAILVPPSGYELLLTSDSMVEGRHFLLEEIGFRRLGKRAMVQNIS
ncbi:MAG: thiamine-phosphate kinase, partial [Desulfatiglandales bacterium]